MSLKIRIPQKTLNRSQQVLRGKNAIAEPMLKALRAHEEGKLDIATENYLRVLQVQPNNVDALGYLGSIALHQDNYEKAIEYLDKAINLKPDDANLHMRKALSLHELKRFNEAIASYNEVLSLDKNHRDAFVNRNVLMVKRFFGIKK